MWYGEVFCVALFGKICFWKRCNNEKRKRFPCLTRCLGKTSLFIWYTRFPGCSKNPDHKYFPGIWPVLQIFLLTHARLVRRRNAKDEKLSGAIWLSASSPLSGKLHSIRNLLSSNWQKNFRSPDPGTIALPCLVCSWRSAIVETLKLSPSCLILAKLHFTGTESNHFWQYPQLLTKNKIYENEKLIK